MLDFTEIEKRIVSWNTQTHRDDPLLIKMIRTYTVHVQEKLTSILSQKEHRADTVICQELTQFLNDNWFETNGFFLSYTANTPELQDVNETLRLLAEMLSKEHNQSLKANEAPLSPEEILMPGATVPQRQTTKIQSREDVMALFQCDAQEIRQLALNEEDKQNIVAQFESIEDLVNWFSGISADKIAAILEMTSPYLLGEFCQHAPGCEALLSRFYEEESQRDKWDTLVKHLFESGYYQLLMDVLVPEQYKRAFDLIPIQERLEIVEQSNKSGHHILHRAALSDPALIEYFLSLYKKDNRLNATFAENQNYQNVLMVAVDQPQSFISILNLLPDQLSKFKALKRLDSIYRQTPLHFAIRMCLIRKNETSGAPQDIVKAYSLLFKTALECLSDEQRMETIQIQNKRGDTLLHLLDQEEPELLRTILNALPSEKRLDSLKMKGARDTVLDLIVTKNQRQSFKIIVESLSESAWSDDTPNDNIMKTLMNLFHSLTNSNDKLIPFLNMLPENQRLATLSFKDNNGATLLETLASSKPLFHKILPLMPDQKSFLLSCIKVKGLLDIQILAMDNLQLFKTVLELSPPETRFNAVCLKRDGQDVSLLLELAKKRQYHSSLEEILYLLPAMDRLRVIATPRPNLLGEILKADNYNLNIATGLWKKTKEDFVRLFDIPVENITNSTLSSEEKKCILNVFASVRTMVEQLMAVPENHLNKALEIIAPDWMDMYCPDNFRCQIFLSDLNKVGNDTKRKIIIKSILESDGRNNFIGAFQIDEYEKAFNLIPKELQLKICKEWRGDGGNTILHLATASPKLLKFFLDLYPSFERRAALDQKNNSGKTVLDIISGNSEKYQEIISFLPEQDRPVKDEVTDKTTAHVLHRGGGPNL